MAAMRCRGDDLRGTRSVALLEEVGQDADGGRASSKGAPLICAGFFCFGVGNFEIPLRPVCR